MAYNLKLRDTDGTPFLMRLADNFIQKNFDNTYTVSLPDTDISVSSHRYRSWEYCRNAFIAARGKELNGTVTENLALHLAFYLASWGMYRGSSFLLSLDFSVHKNIVETVMAPKYSDLFDSDTLIKEKRTKYLNLMFGDGNEKGVVQEITDWYNLWHGKVLSSPIDDPTGELTHGTNEKDVSAVLVTKVLMGVYGCIPAYDRYVADGLKTQNINATFGRKAVEELLNKTVDNEIIYENINCARRAIIEKKAPATEAESYTFMKVLDILFWEIGAGSTVYVTVNEIRDTLSEMDISIISNIENRIKENNFSNCYNYEIGGIQFRSKDIGSLIMCVYEEFKKQLKGNTQIRKKEIKEHIETCLEPDWLATARYSRKLIRNRARA